ncbi:T9SS type A sorting domain-containing protein [Sanyastnella coralliicola]|uniref:T9SS type A sorting domain-containing protein n=1 Tax=Sanyastnella coralliicola TaxID=3069118 RepID=UPI0027B99B14|nr:T9SS type A sorting domain-containing protein [Longitalea sp. SCSIO 12813]
MKRLLLSLILTILVSFSYAQDVELLDHYTVDEITEILQDFGLNSDLVNLQHEVDFYKVTYQTIHPNGDSVQVTGAFCLPSDLDCPLPLSSYQHGTVALKINVPSYQNYESRLGLLYASAGYAITMPDYIGLGDSPGMHLYVHAESQANASLDLIRAAHNLQDELDFELDDQLFLWGYSQGGHATMALHKKIETEFSDEFTVTGSAPMSGPYDISGSQAEVLTSDEVYPTPGYMPYVILSYQEVYGNLYEELEDIFLPQYAAVIPDLFTGLTTMGQINNAFPDVPSEMLVPEVLEAFETDPQHPLRLALADNDVYDWAPTAPTNLYYCTGDDQVGYMNSVVAEETMIANGSTTVQALDGGNFDHGECAPFAMLAGYNFFESLREQSFNPSYVLTQTPASAVDAADGSVTIDFANAEAGWTIEWSNGQTGDTAINLLPGEYVVTVSDGVCSASFTVVVDWSNSVSYLAKKKLKAYPNPIQGALRIEVSTSGTVTIYDSQGRVLRQGMVNDNTIWDLSGLESGSYLLRTEDGEVISLIKQ